MNKNLLTQKQLANYLQISVKALKRLRNSGKGPKYIKLGPHVRYRAEDVAEWLSSNVWVGIG